MENKIKKVCVCVRACSVASVMSDCDAMNCSMPGFPVLHSLPEFAQTHVHCINNAIQQSHPLSPPSPPPLSPVKQSHQKCLTQALRFNSQLIESQLDREISQTTPRNAISQIQKVKTFYRTPCLVSSKSQRHGEKCGWIGQVKRYFSSVQLLSHVQLFVTP